VLAISGCKPSVEDTTKSVQSSMQSKFDSDDDFSKYHMIVDSVSLVRESDNKFNGVAHIKYKGKEHEIPIKVTADNKNVLWETENFAFSFLALDALSDLTNAGTDDVNNATSDTSSNPLTPNIVKNPEPSNGYPKYKLPSQNNQLYLFDLFKLFPSLESTVLRISGNQNSLVNKRVSGVQNPIEIYEDGEILANGCVPHMCLDNEIRLYINNNGAIAFYIIDDGFNDSTQQFDKKLMYFSNLKNPKDVPSKLYESMKDYLSNPEYQMIENPNVVNLNSSKDITGRIQKFTDSLSKAMTDENKKSITKGIVIKHSDLDLNSIGKCPNNIDIGSQKYPLGKTLKTFFNQSYAFINESGDYLLSESCEDDILKTCSMRSLDFKKNRFIQYRSNYTNYKHTNLEFSDFMKRALTPEDDMIWSDIKSICKFNDYVKTSNYFCNLQGDNISCQNLRTK